MATLTVWGASDDLIELEGIQGADEYNEIDGHWQGIIETPTGETARLYVDYRENGCWTVTLGRYDEGYALPNWEVSTTSKDDICAYSTYVTIELPDGSTVTYV